MNGYYMIDYLCKCKFEFLGFWKRVDGFEGKYEFDVEYSNSSFFYCFGGRNSNI